jgi:hypothetical protein
MHDIGGVLPRFHLPRRLEDKDKRRAISRLPNSYPGAHTPLPKDGSRNTGSLTWAVRVKYVRCFRHFYRLCRSCTC